MIKRILSIFLSLVICLSIFPATAYAKESKAYKKYQEAMLTTTASGSWSEVLTMTANIAISDGSTKMKTKATVASEMDISNYDYSNFSSIKMSGSASISIMNQIYAWDMIYENGIARYTYTEPAQTSAELEIDPCFFKFETITDDMMEKAKVSGNKITFTIPGNKVEQVGIDAVNLMPGITNLDYDDVDTEVVLDKDTGAIDKVAMTFHASLIYQGYEAEVDYCIDYGFILNTSNGMTDSAEADITELEIDDGIIIYSDHQNLSIRKDSIITLSAGIIIGGEPLTDVSGITFWTDDSSLLDICDTGIQNNRRYVKFKGIDIGTTYVYFNDSNTGYTAKVLITVYEDNFLSYTLSSVPTQYIEEYPTNIYNANGLYVDNYNYSVGDNGTAKVSFDVYNTNYTYGVVEVYTENGTLKDAVLIKKMGSYNTSIKKALWDNMGCLIRDMIDGDFLSYRQESGFSKMTPVSVEIPQNGYIKICNDPQNSAVVNIVNSVDVLMLLGKLANKVKNYDVNAEVFSEELTLKLINEKTFAELVKDGSKLQEDLWKGVAKEAVFSTDSLGDFCNTISKNLSEFEVGELIADTAEDFGWSVGEEVFKYFTGPVKMVFDGLFAFGKLENIILQHTDLISSANVGSIYIQNQGGGTRTVQQITVESDTGFSDDTSLNVFRVSLDAALLDIIRASNPEVYDAIMDGTSYTYNISLMKNGEETQPDDEVKVYVPIPDDLKLLAYAGKAKLFRVEEDGALTEMDVEIEDGCFVFKTSHFSLYTLVGDTAMQNMIIIGTLLGGIALFIFVVIRKARKRKNK